MTIAEVTRRYTLARLKANDGDKTTTAKELGISLKTLYNWLNRWEEDLTPPSDQVPLPPASPPAPAPLPCVAGVPGGHPTREFTLWNEVEKVSPGDRYSSLV